MRRSPLVLAALVMVLALAPACGGRSATRPAPRPEPASGGGAPAATRPGGPGQVPKSAPRVETAKGGRIATEVLEKNLKDDLTTASKGVLNPKVRCKAPLEAKVGATSECEVTDPKEPKPGIANLRVNKVNGDQVVYEVASLRDK